MKLSRREKVFSVAIAIALILGILIGTQIKQPVSLNSLDRLPSGGVFSITIRKADGTIILNEQVHNLIVTIGKTKARDYFSAGSTDITKYLSLSNDATPLVSWTKLPNEVGNTNGFGRAAGTVSTVNATAYQTQKQWTATGTETLQCVGVNWSATLQSDNNLYAAGTFTQTTFGSGDTLTITYTLNYG